MSDIAVVYTLTLPGGTIVFNNGVIPSFDDMYFITNVRGLDQGPIRTPEDDQPQGDGGLDHDFFGGPMHPFFEGEILVQSTRVDTEIQTIRNTMIKALRTALRSAYRVADIGSLAWTPLGDSDSYSLPVRCEIPLETDGVEQKFFTFGLYSGDHDPTAA